MSFPKLLTTLYEQVKTILSETGIAVDPAKKIQYGLQFEVFLLGKRSTVRLYQNKKGLKIDLSQVKDEHFHEQISSLLLQNGLPHGGLLCADKPVQTSFVKEHPEDPDTLIGVDESGKGDYFGPLVIAGVYVTPETAPLLEEMGIRDSKTMTDRKMVQLEPKIKKLCAHSLVVMHNKSYNEIYDTMKNLNHILAWGHAKVIENTLEQVDCDHALCDQFGSPGLIKKALTAKGKGINLLERHRAESNIAVAAASVLARASFVTEMKELEEKMAMKLPLGCSDKTVAAAQKLVEEQGKEILDFVAKVHFKVTQKIT